MAYLPTPSTFTTLCADALPSELWAAVQGLLGKNGELAAQNGELAAQNGELTAENEKLKARVSRFVFSDALFIALIDGLPTTASRMP